MGFRLVDGYWYIKEKVTILLYINNYKFIQFEILFKKWKYNN
jgi:hypothetical protein